MKHASLPRASMALAVAILSTQSYYVAADQLAPVVITASRTAETADQTLASVTIIDREEIERSQATDITELLAGLTGVNIAANGGDGKSKSLFLRGTNSSHTLLLIDGVRVGSATLGSPAWALIPLSDIDRVEIVRGPRSSLYGSDAIGGVIQIFTRKGGDGLKTRFEAGFGTDSHSKVSASISNGNRSGRYNLSISGEKTDGYDTKDDSETDDDGYDNLSISGGFSHQISESLELSGNLLRSQGENEFDGSIYSGNSTDFVQQSVGLALKAKVNDQWESTVRLGQSRDEGDNYFNGSFVNSINTRRDQLSWENIFFLNDNSQLTAGIDYLNDHVSGSTAYSVTERYDKSLFAQYRYFGEQNDFQLGLRWGDNEQFGDHTTGNIAWGHAFNDNLRLTASVGTAFKAPTFNDLYWPANPFSGGNPNLVQEESRSYELGLDGNHGGVKWGVRAYKSKIENLIDWDCTANCNDADPWNDFWQPSNVSQAEIKGLELQASTQLYGWDGRATVNLLDPKNESTGNILPKRVKRSLRLDLDRDFGRWSLGGTLLAESGRWNNAYNTIRLGGYATLDLRASYHLNSEWSLQGTIDNLFDRGYETTDGFRMPGRELFISMVYQSK